ncbi:MAG: ABC transporter permease [Cyanobacteria bacterium P01_H01_bin.121]
MLRPLKLWRETSAIAQRILTELWRRRRSLIFWAVFPVTILILNGLILAERLQIEQGEAFASAAPATLVGAALFFSCVGGSVSTVVAEREQQTLKRLFISPLSGTAYFLGIFVAHSCIGIGQTVLVIIATLIAGGEFEGSWGLGALIVVLSIMTYVGVGFILGAQFARRTEDVNALVATFGVPLLILGGIFLPTAFFPESLQQLSQYNPIYHMNEALTVAVLDPDNITSATFRNHLSVLIGLSVGVTGAGWFAYRQMLRRERSF